MVTSKRGKIFLDPTGGHYLGCPAQDGKSFRKGNEWAILRMVGPG
jgi:hypothetical protein